MSSPLSSFGGKYGYSRKPMVLWENSVENTGIALLPCAESVLNPKTMVGVFEVKDGVSAIVRTDNGTIEETKSETLRLITEINQRYGEGAAQVDYFNPDCTAGGKWTGEKWYAVVQLHFAVPTA